MSPSTPNAISHSSTSKATSATNPRHLTPSEQTFSRNHQQMEQHLTQTLFKHASHQLPNDYFTFRSVSKKMKESPRAANQQEGIKKESQTFLANDAGEPGRFISINKNDKDKRFPYKRCFLVFYFEFGGVLATIP